MPKKFSQETRSLVLTTYKSGLTMREVADKLGITMSSVSRIIASFGYDRTHVGGRLTRSVPVVPDTAPAAPNKASLVTMSRTQKMYSELTGILYTVSTESDTITIESDQALMELPVGLIDRFVEELIELKKFLKVPS